MFPKGLSWGKETRKTQDRKKNHKQYENGDPVVSNTFDVYK